MGTIAIGNRIGRKAGKGLEPVEPYISFVTTKQNLTIPVKEITGLFEINYNDGTVEPLKESSTHNYSSPGTNVVTITMKEKGSSLVSISLSRLEILSIDLSNPFILKELPCSFNKLSSIDTSKLSLLEMLSVAGNPITSINLSKNTKLKTLYCGDTEITSLNLQKNTELFSLSLSGKILIEEIDCTNNPKLSTFATPSVGNQSLKSIDFSGTSLVVFSTDQMVNLNSAKFNNCTSLANISIVKCALETLEIKNCKNLGYLDCNTNHLKSIGTDNLSMNTVKIHNNLFSYIDISDFNYNKLSVFDCSNNVITEFSPIPSLYELLTLKASNNLLTSLDLINLGDSLRTIDVSNNPYLTEIKASTSLKLSAINIDNCTSLLRFFAQGSTMETIHFSNLPALTFLACPYWQKLTSFSTTNCSNIEELRLNNDYLLKEVQLSDYPKLKTLVFENSLLAKLDVSKNPVLESLNIVETPLSKNQVNLIEAATALPDRTGMNPVGRLSLSNPTSATWIRSICTDKNWIIS